MISFGDRRTPTYAAPDTRSKRAAYYTFYALFLVLIGAATVQLIKSADKYPFFRSAIAVRTKITRLLLLIFVFQEIFFFAYRRYTKRFYIPLRALNCLCWIIGGVWLLTVYRIY